MGYWGYGIRQNDTFGDVMATFIDYLKSNPDVSAATNHVKQVHAEYMDDIEDGPLFWQALADMQWTYGKLDPKVLKQVQNDLKSEVGLDLWREESERDYRKRKAAVEKFIAKIETPRPKPKKMPKVKIRKPKFTAGDCLAIQLSNGQYGAALVTASDDSNPELGWNAVVTIDYLSDEPPTVYDIQSRRWLHFTHGAWDGRIEAVQYYEMGFRKANKRIKVVGTIPILKNDPTECESSGSWEDVGEQVILQRAWEEEQRGH